MRHLFVALSLALVLACGLSRPAEAQPPGAFNLVEVELNPQQSGDSGSFSTSHIYVYYDWDTTYSPFVMNYMGNTYNLYLKFRFADGMGNYPTSWEEVDLINNVANDNEAAGYYDCILNLTATGMANTNIYPLPFGQHNFNMDFIVGVRHTMWHISPNWSTQEHDEWPIFRIFVH